MFKLSVLTPNYCHGEYLNQSINSVLEQSDFIHEYIVCDDSSTDNSLEILDQFKNQIKIKKNSQNIGAYATLRKLFGEATGDYIAIICADDYYLPNFFKKAMKMADCYPEAGIIFGEMVIVDKNSNEIGTGKVSHWNKPCYVSPDKFLKEYLDKEPPNHSLCNATIYKKSALKEIGYFNTYLGPWGDTFAARAIGLKYGACYIPESVVCWRYLSSSLSNTMADSHTKALELVDDAKALMLSPQFADRFPNDHVHKWAENYKTIIMKRYKETCIS